MIISGSILLCLCFLNYEWETLRNNTDDLITYDKICLSGNLGSSRLALLIILFSRTLQMILDIWNYYSFLVFCNYQSKR